MKKLARSEDGLSLVELLAVLAISSIIILFISTIHIFIQNQYNSQSTEVKELTDVTVAMRAITKDIRSAEGIIDSENPKELILVFEEGNVSYLFENETLKKNGTSYIYELEDFEAVYNDPNIQLKIVSQSGKEAKTEIVLRKGDESNEQ